MNWIQCSHRLPLPNARVLVWAKPGFFDIATYTQTKKLRGWTGRDLKPFPHEIVFWSEVIAPPNVTVQEIPMPNEPDEPISCTELFACDIDALRARVDALMGLLSASEARVAELSRAYAVQGLAIEEMRADRDRYREALRKLLPEQDPLDAEIVCDYCGATVPFDEAQNEHKEDCPWLMTYGTKDPK